MTYDYAFCMSSRVQQELYWRQRGMRTLTSTPRDRGYVHWQVGLAYLMTVNEEVHDVVKSLIVVQESCCLITLSSGV